MTVQRYSIEAACCLGMEDQTRILPDSEGDFVEYSAYEDLADEAMDTLSKLERVQEDYDRLVAGIRELYQSA